MLGAISFIVLSFLFRHLYKQNQARNRRIAETARQRMNRERTQGSPEAAPGQDSNIQASTRREVTRCTRSEVTRSESIQDRILSEVFDLEIAPEHSNNVHVASWSDITPHPTPNLRVTFTTADHEGRITVETDPGIPVLLEISALSPPSYQESMRAESGSLEIVPSYEEVMAQSESGTEI